MALGPAKHEKVARTGRISNVFRIVEAQSAEQSVGIMGAKYPAICQNFSHSVHLAFCEWDPLNSYIVCNSD